LQTKFGNNGKSRSGDQVVIGGAVYQARQWLPESTASTGSTDREAFGREQGAIYEIAFYAKNGWIVIVCIVPAFNLCSSTKSSPQMNIEAYGCS
jgi:hypothetical protein